MTTLYSELNQVANPLHSVHYSSKYAKTDCTSELGWGGELNGVLGYHALGAATLCFLTVTSHTQAEQSVDAETDGTCTRSFERTIRIAEQRPEVLKHVFTTS